MLKPKSELKDYVASGIGGAIAAIPGGGFVGSLLAGAAGNVVSNAMKGNIKSFGDAKGYAKEGAVANGIGWGVSKAFAAIKVLEINNLPRSNQKIILRDSVFKNSQANVNANLSTFHDSSLPQNILRIENSNFFAFRSGIYSSITSTLIPIF